MAISPVSGSTGLPELPADAAFEGAIARAAAADELPAGFEDALITGAITVGGQMIIMPRANDILGEVMSDE